MDKQGRRVFGRVCPEFDPLRLHFEGFRRMLMSVS
jgi:hypothetical protein